MLRHLLQKVLCTWPLHYINVGDTALNVDWNCVVLVPDLIELTVNESFIQI